MTKLRKLIKTAIKEAWEHEQVFEYIQDDLYSSIRSLLCEKIEGLLAEYNAQSDVIDDALDLRENIGRCKALTDLKRLLTEGK